jgi:hypothetical protein
VIPIFVSKDRTFEGEYWGEEKIAQISAAVTTLRPKFLLITGDITDAGSGVQWNRAKTLLLDPAHRAGVGILMAPGNHDLQGVFSDVLDVHSREDNLAQGDRARSFLEMETIFEPSLRTVSGDLVAEKVNWHPSAEEVSKEAQRYFPSCTADCNLGFNDPTKPSAGAAMACAKACLQASEPKQIHDMISANYILSACRDWFPLLRDTDEARFIILCSNGKPNYRVANNAIGSLGAGQLERFKQAVMTVPDGTHHVFILMHHSIVHPTNDLWWTLPKTLTLDGFLSSPLVEYSLLGADPDEAIEIISTLGLASLIHPEMRFFLLYGHRHQRFHGTVQNVTVSEAPAAFEADGAWLAYRLPGSPDLRWQYGKW